MSLVPTDLFSFERKSQSHDTRYKIDYYVKNPERQEYAIYLRSKLEDDLNI